jgi:hypothetical protein
MLVRARALVAPAVLSAVLRPLLRTLRQQPRVLSHLHYLLLLVSLLQLVVWLLQVAVLASISVRLPRASVGVGKGPPRLPLHIPPLLPVPPNFPQHRPPDTRQRRWLREGGV